MNFKEEYLLTAPYHFEKDDFLSVFQDVQNIWPPEQYRAGIGSFISLKKAKAAQFGDYDGLFSPVMKQDKENDTMLKPARTYLCGYKRENQEKTRICIKKCLSTQRRIK